MRRLLVVAVLLACDASGLAQLTVRAAHRPEPTPAVAARLAALDPAGARLAAGAVAADGTLRRLDGALELQGATPEERAADFLARYAPLFGADAAVEFGAARSQQPRADGSPRALRLPQTVHGWEVDDAGLTLALDAQGRATGAHGFLSAEAARLPLPTVTAQQARDAALAALGLTLAALRGEPVVHGAVRLAGAPVLVQRVQLVVRAGLRPLQVDVDARSGAVISISENASDAKGHITFDGVPLVFDLATGSGSAYTSLSGAKSGQQSLPSLSGLTLSTIDEVSSLVPGTLTGRYCTVSDTVGVIFNPLLTFPFADTDPGLVDPVHSDLVIGEAFDHVNTYYWITRTAKAYTAITGTLPSDTCVPIIVNFDENDAHEHVGFPNAYFSPDDLDGTGPFAPGFMVFGDLDVATGDLMDDFSRDPTIVSHEYFHCMASFGGLQFGSDPDHKDTPQRAVNEAIADYGSASIHKTPLIGKALVFNAGAFLGIDTEALRDLTSPINLVDNLFDTVDPFNGNLPEEHEAGKIYGCALWRLRSQAKAKTADDLIVNNLATWPQSSAEVGFPVITVGNAQAAYEAYDFECFLALANAAIAPGGSKGWNHVSKVLGAFLAHGITGSTPGTIAELPTNTGKPNLSFSSEFLGTRADHVFELDLVAGQQLSISLTGDKQDGTQVDFAFTGGPALTVTKDKVVNTAGTKLSQKGLVASADGVYVLDLFTTSGPGAYKAVIKIK